MNILNYSLLFVISLVILLSCNNKVQSTNDIFDQAVLSIPCQICGTHDSLSDLDLIKAAMIATSQHGNMQFDYSELDEQYERLSIKKRQLGYLFNASIDKAYSVCIESHDFHIDTIDEYNKYLIKEYLSLEMDCRFPYLIPFKNSIIYNDQLEADFSIEDVRQGYRDYLKSDIIKYINAQIKRGELLYEICGLDYKKLNPITKICLIEYFKQITGYRELWEYDVD